MNATDSLMAYAHNYLPYKKGIPVVLLALALWLQGCGNNAAETNAFEQARQEMTVPALRQFLAEYPKGDHAVSALALLETLDSRVDSLLAAAAPLVFENPQHATELAKQVLAIAPEDTRALKLIDQLEKLALEADGTDSTIVPEPAKTVKQMKSGNGATTAPAQSSAASTPAAADPEAAALRRAQEEAMRLRVLERQREIADRQAEQERLAREQAEQKLKKDALGGGQIGGSGTSGIELFNGGLAGRRVVERPRMVDDTQKTGKVVVRVCVDADGIVTSASYSQAGSTTADPALRAKAEDWAREYRFTPSSVPEQCGVITFDFRVK